MPINKIITNLYDEDETNNKTNGIMIKKVSNSTWNENSSYYNNYINLDLLGIEKIDDSSKTLNRIVYYAMKITGHLPKNFLIPDQSMFWNETILPMINRTMFHEAQARQVIRKGFDLISVHSNNTIVCCNTMSYNQDHLKIFKKIILNNLKLLNLRCNQLNNLATESWLEFSKFSEIIVNIIGPEAALYMDKQALLETKIKQYELKREKLIIELNYNKGKLQILEKQMYEQLRQIETIINKQECVLNDIKELYITRNWLKKMFSKHQIKSSLNNKLTIFNDRIQKNKVKLVKQKFENFQLNQKLSDLNAKLDTNRQEFEKLKTHIDTIEPVIEKSQAKYQNKIDKSRLEIDKILNRKNFVQNNIGLNGTVLIEFLTYLRLFAKEILKTTDIYSTINSILNEIKSSIQCPIALLNSPSFANVLIGQKMLYSHASRLLAYSRDARKSIANNHHKRCWLIHTTNDHQNN